MGFIDDHQIIVAPVHVGQVDVPGEAAITGQIGMIQDVIVEAVGGQNVASVIGLVDSPVVPQPFGAEDEDPFVAQFAVFNDGQRFEGLPQPHTVGNDAAAEAIELVDGAHHPVPLEPVEFLPDQRVPDTGARIDNPLLVKFIGAILKQVMEDQDVDSIRISVRRQIMERAGKSLLCVRCCRETVPEGTEPGSQHGRFLGAFGALDQAELIARSQAETVGGERTVTGDDFLLSGIRMAGNNGGLGEELGSAAEFDLFSEPVAATAGQPPDLELIAKRAIGVGAEQEKIGSHGGRDNQPAVGELVKKRTEFGKGEERE